MVDLIHTFEGGTPGATVATTDTGSGNAFSTVERGAGAHVYSIEQKMHGAKSGKITQDSTPNGNYVAWTALTDSGGLAMRAYVYLTVPLTNGMYLLQARNAAGRAGQVQINNANRFQVDDAATFGVASNTAATFPLSQWVRSELLTIPGTTTSNGTIMAAYYIGDSMTPVYEYNSAARNTGTATLAAARIGAVAGGLAGLTMYLDSLGAKTGTASFMGPYVPPPVTTGWQYGSYAMFSAAAPTDPSDAGLGLSPLGISPLGA